MAEWSHTDQTEASTHTIDALFHSSLGDFKLCIKETILIQPQA